MTARISRQFNFQAAIHFENKFIINTYDIVLFMDILTEDAYQQTVALERIKFIFYNRLENAILISSNEKKAIENYINAGINICTMPDDPFDQIVAAILIKKFNSICEQKFHITEMKIKSYLCDDVEFYINADDEVAELNDSTSWWNSSDNSVNNLPKMKNTVEKVVELKKEKTDWVSVNLSWKPKNNKSGQDIVIFTLDK